MAVVLASVLSCAAVAGAETREVWTVPSPGGTVSITVTLTGGALRYSVRRGPYPVLLDSELGLQRADASFTSGLVLATAADPVSIDEVYTMPHGKSSHLLNSAMERMLEFANPQGKRLQLVVRAYDDGVAFRYRFPENDMSVVSVTDERTAFTFANNGRAVLQPKAPESLHDIVPIQDPPGGVGGWALPALFDMGHSWAMIAESDVDASYCAAQLDKGDGYREYMIRIPDDHYGVREPGWRLPWEMPWRVVIVGPSAASIVESNLVTHLADSCRIADTSWIRPGRASWHWWSGAWVGNIHTLERYVDLAQTMGWEYSLVDADWDDYHSDAVMQGLVSYAAERGVGLFLWYNSAGPQNQYTFSPRDRMWDSEIRRAEMAKIAAWGVKGIKVDFFDSDKQVMMQRYVGILSDAADAGLLVSFHGSTPPRGWSRTWPNMLTTEAVRGAEYYKSEPTFPADAPLHNVEVVFTRNVVGPMDYTPVTFSDVQNPHLTTNAHELALSVVFESGIVHLADKVESYQAQPEEVRDFLAEVPAAWDETRLIEGDPSTHVVLARRRGDVWYVAGINGGSAQRTVSVALDPFGYPGSGGTCISDGQTPRTFTFTGVSGNRLDVVMSARGGFVARLPRPSTGVDLPSPLGDEPPLAIGAAEPNPFIVATNVRVTLSGAARVLVSIHDPAGRRVRTLLAGDLPGGVHTFAWDGRDDAGVPVPAGVYFSTARSGNRTVAVPVHRLR